MNWLKAARFRILGLNLLALATVAFFTFFPILHSQFEASSAALKFYVVFHRTLFSAGIAWFMLAVFMNLNHFTWLAKFFSLKIWQPFSQLTYSMYLIHFIVVLGLIKTVEVNLKAIDGIGETTLIWATISLTSLLSLIFCIIIGVLCWLLIEKPFLNMRDLFQINRGATSSAPISSAITSVDATKQS